MELRTTLERMKSRELAERHFETTNRQSKQSCNHEPKSAQPKYLGNRSVDKKRCFLDDYDTIDCKAEPTDAPKRNSKTKNALANGAPRQNGKRENNIGIPNQERSISGEPYRQRHKARTSIDCYGTMNTDEGTERTDDATIEKRQPRQPTTKQPRLVYDNNRQRRSAHKASHSSKRRSK